MRSVRVSLVVLLLAGLLVAPGNAASGASARSRFELYTGVVTAQEAQELQQRYDHDVVSARKRADGKVAVDVILNEIEQAKLASQGLALGLKRNGKGQTATQAAAAQVQAGLSVYRKYGGAGGIKEEIQALAKKYPSITKVVSIGKTLNGQDILALKVTNQAKTIRDGQRPATLYLGTQHAREWISPEVTRRLMHHFVKSYSSSTTLRSLINANEYWFVPVANPDGYDHTFLPGNRLWRKNLRDNNGDGFIDADNDGVDLNRNFPTHWGYDDEGSSTEFASQTYRGTAPASEPETKAMDGLMNRIGFNFVVNYHSAAELILYGVGWQLNTHTPDDLAYITLAGNDAKPAIDGFDPDLSAELYTTNGDTTDHAHETYGSLAFTPELTTCQSVSDDPTTCQSGFNFPDNESLIQAEFTKNLPFALDIAKSTHKPGRPKSHLGNVAPNFKTDPFTVSYGTPQPVAIWANRDLGALTLNYSVNGGATQTAPTAEWTGGERYGDTNDVYYREVRGSVTKGAVGDTVKVWFTGGGKTSPSFTYTVASDSGDDVLVLANEDYSGRSNLPGYPAGNGARFASYYTDALTANGIASDVYDVDAHGRKAPHHLGVLGHYDAVVWYSGNDLVTRRLNHPAPSASLSSLIEEITVSVRDYLNEGGKLLATGQYLGYQQTLGFEFNAAGEPPYCEGDVGPEECLVLSNDFFQYYLGAYQFNLGAGMGEEDAWPLSGTNAPFTGLTFELNGEDSAQNQVLASSLLPTSNFLPAEDYPQFASKATAEYVRGGGAPYSPHSGDYYVFSQADDVSYKRMTRTVDMTSASSGELRFWMSGDAEIDWDYVVVEAHTVGQDDWTTLPDSSANHLTSQDMGESCPEGWHELHPHLARYQTVSPDGPDSNTLPDCSPTGTSGAWHGFTGNSAGWHEWVADLSGFAGKQVEVSISYISDWGTQGLGVFIDDARVLVGGAEVAATDFETDFGGWAVPGAPAGSDPNGNDWIRSLTAFEEGAAVSTEDTHYFPFGFEGVTGAAKRAELMGRVMDDLLE